MSYVAGDLFDFDCVENIRLEDIELPEEIMRLFPGPKFGPSGIKEIIDVKEQRPLLGITIKPSLGITSQYVADKCLLAAKKGADFITDNEKLVNPSYCTIDRRVEAVSQVLREVESECGKKLLYIINISHSADKIRNMATKALRCPRAGLMVCFIAGGLGCIQTLAEDNSVDAPIWAHRTMHAAFTRNPQHGINMNVLTKLCRLVGADFQHIGPIAGTHIVYPEQVITQRNIMSREEDWFGLKPSFPVVTGGVHPGNVEAMVKMLGSNIAFAVGTAVFASWGFRRGSNSHEASHRCCCKRYINPKIRYGQSGTRKGTTKMGMEETVTIQKI